MKQSQFALTRRQTLAGLGATTALSLTGCKIAGDDLPVTSLNPDDWLEQVGYNLLRHEPERATSLGVDVGQFADLRGKLEHAADCVCGGIYFRCSGYDMAHAAECGSWQR